MAAATTITMALLSYPPETGPAKDIVVREREAPRGGRVVGPWRARGSPPGGGGVVGPGHVRGSLVTRGLGGARGGPRGQGRVARANDDSLLNSFQYTHHISNVSTYSYSILYLECLDTHT